MDSKKKRKCRTCGRLFVPAGAGDFFCSAVCRATGKFVGGGGDTSKPLNYEQRRALEKRGGSIPLPKEKPQKVRNGSEKYPRVAHMLSLPLEKRWEVAKTFTEDEQDYFRRLSKRMLAEERKMDVAIRWEGDEETDLGSYEGLVGGRLGESDDGTV